MNKKSKKILFICPYPKDVAPSQRLKYEQYFDYFEKEGFIITVKPFVSIKFWNIIYKKGFWFKKVLFTILGYISRFFLLFKVNSYDIVYVHLWVTPFGFSFFEFLIRQLSKKIVYDIDDMIFLGHSSYANKPTKFLKGKVKIIYLIKKADYIITSTPALYQFANNYNVNVVEIPTTINVKSYQPKSDYIIRDALILGYSGSHSTTKYLKAIEPAFVKLLHETNIKFKVLVIGDTNFQFENKEIPLEKIEWSIENEKKYLPQMDIGLYPLTDEPWVYGKRGGKVLLYMVHALPIIATAVGTNLDTFKDKEDGLLVSLHNIKEWFNAIKMLFNDMELREKLGKNARKKSEYIYSVDENYYKYLNVLNNL